MNAAVCFTRDGRTDGVDNTHAERATFETVPHRQDRVSSLSALADEHANIITENWSLPVQEVRSQLDADRYFCQLLKDGSSGQAGMITGATRREDDPTAAANDREVCPETTESNRVSVKVDTTTHSVDHGFGLLVNFLLHKVVELALHDLCELKLQGLDASSSGGLGRGDIALLCAAEPVDVQFSLGNMGNIVIFQIEDTLSVLDDCGGVGSDEELDRLRHAILGHKSPRLRTSDAVTSGWRGEETSSGGGRRRYWPKRSVFIPEYWVGGLTRFGSILGAGDLDINEINLKFLLGLNSD